MPAKSSDKELLRKLSKVLTSIGYQPESISAAADPKADHFTVEFTGSRAVDDCVKAYNEAFRKSMEKEKLEAYAREAGAKAYRQAIPALHGSTNIADFIACVGHALVLGCIGGQEATRLLYAAQVAHTALPSFTRDYTTPRRPGRPKASESNESSPQSSSQNAGWEFLNDPEYLAWRAKTFPNGFGESTPNAQKSPDNE